MNDEQDIDAVAVTDADLDGDVDMAIFIDVNSIFETIIIV